MALEPFFGEQCPEAVRIVLFDIQQCKDIDGVWTLLCAVFDTFPLLKPIYHNNYHQLSREYFTDRLVEILGWFASKGQAIQ